jgi:methyl-accepting chemotaxis protein WspA
MIRSAWVDSYLQTQELLGLKEGQGISAKTRADYKALRRGSSMANYRSTVTTDEDRPNSRPSRRPRRVHRIQDAVLDLHKRNQEAEAVKLFNEVLTPAWTAGA